MKKLALGLALLAMLVAVIGCGSSTSSSAPNVLSKTYGGHTSEECAVEWDGLDVDAGDESFYVNLILNTVHAPDSVGFLLEECINGGWTGWR